MESSFEFVFLCERPDLFKSLIDLLSKEWDVSHLREIEHDFSPDPSPSLPATLLMLDNEGKLIGHSCIEEMDSITAEISFVIVETNRRGKGLGKILMNKINGECSRRFSFSYSIVKCKGERISFYTRCGYSLIGETEEKDDDKILHLMRKSL